MPNRHLKGKDMFKTFCAAMMVSLVAGAAVAENATYGRIDLLGSATETWELNNFAIHNVMVCNVNGPDGFLSVRSGPGTNFEQVRAFNRIAILEVDVTQRQGRWVRVVNGYRTHTVDGLPQALRELPVTGWAHDGYLCDFQDF
jgi:hypothetical protein